MLIWNACDTFSLAKRREKQKHLLDFSVVDWARLDLVSMDVWKRCTFPSPLGAWAVIRDNCSKGSQSTPRRNENNLKTFMIIKTISHLKSQSQDSFLTQRNKTTSFAALESKLSSDSVITYKSEILSILKSHHNF